MARKRSDLNIYERKNEHRFEGRYRVVDEITGAKKSKSVYGKTRQEVRNKLIKAEAGLVKPTVKTSMTFGELITLWLEYIVAHVKTSTYANYKIKVDSHILPELGNIRYDFLTAEKLNRFIADKLKSGRIKNGGALSERYVRDIAVLIKSVCKFAAKNHSFHNPAANIDLPKPKFREVSLLSKSEQSKLIKNLLTAEKFFSLGVLLCLFTGIRIGELAALTWNDVDFEARKIHIRHTLQRVKTFDHDNAYKTELQITEPKSDTSCRSIPIHDLLFSILLKVKADDNFYVLSGSAKPVEPRTIQNRFKRLLKNAGLPSINFHALRHMFATNCLQCGCDVKSLSAMLGHASVETTFKLYVHTSDERMQECINMLDIAA